MTAGTQASLQPVMFLDIDDVLCLVEPYGCAHVRDTLIYPDTAPLDLWKRLFRSEAVSALNSLLEQFEPRVVLTTSWLSLLEKEHFIQVFKLTGLERVSSCLHEVWDAPSNVGTSRLDAIDGWIQANHRGQPIFILDDRASGESLVDSFHHQAGRALLCEPGLGFHAGMLPAASRALRTPYSTAEPWK